MTDEEYKDLVTDHDKSIGVMAASIEHLATAVGSTNNKLDKVVSVIGRQNILMEKFSNLEQNLKESFDRVHSRAERLENKDKELEDETRKILPPSLLKWILGVMIAYSISFGTYVIKTQHALETSISTHIAEDKYINVAYDFKIDELMKKSTKNSEDIRKYTESQDSSK